MTSQAREAGQSGEPERAATWVLTDGTVGMENQGLAVAEALGLPYALKRVKRRGPWRRLPTTLQVLLPPGLLMDPQSLSGDRLEPPFPRVLISIGRHSVPLALALRRRARGQTLALHIQDPKVDPRRFDIVAAPSHDALEGGNVVTTLGAPHRVTLARCLAEAEAVRADVDALPHPRIAVLVGGASKAFALTRDAARRLGEALAQLARASGGSLLVTPSRRTGVENTTILAEALAGLPSRVWTGAGANPYFAYLGLADAIVVTSDSVNMVTEAAGTGKPVYIYDLEGHSKRLARFHAAMRAAGATRPFDGRLAFWSYPPINDTEKIAMAVRAALGSAPAGGKKFPDGA